MGSALSWLASIVLLLIHVGYSVVNAARSLREGLCARDPRPLAAKRKQVPSHLAVLFASHDDAALDLFESEMLDNIEQVVAWCQVAGVKRLTVYDRRGVLARSSFALRERLQTDRIEDDVSASDSDIDYPLTPPLSDAGSRPLSPQRETPPKLHVISMSLRKPDDASQTPKKRHSLVRRHPHHKSGTEDEPFHLHVISRDSGKAAIANTATGLLHQALADTLSTAETYTANEKELNAVLEGKYGFTSPELMIIHNILPQRRCKDVLELHGFPPWQVRLTEFHHTQYSMSFWSQWHLLRGPAYIALSEVALRRALDEFASAEMRLGK